MEKIIVIGCPGSGKSTFSKALHEITNIPLFHLDNLYWNSDRTTVSKSVFSQRLSQILLQNTWIIDGNYASTMVQRMEACDTIIFLDYPTELCLNGIYERKNKCRSDIPWVETTNPDPEFIAFVENFQQEGRIQILNLLSQHTQKNVFIFRTRDEATNFLKELTLYIDMH